MYAVTRQSNYYDDGAYSVEVARQFDFAGPGALVAQYADEFGESDDPREVAEWAIRIRREWTRDLLASGDAAIAPELLTDGRIPFTIAGNSFVYATVNDGMTAAALRRWAKAEWTRLPKCEYCDGVAESEDNWHDEYGDPFTACCDSHAERIMEDRYAMLEDEPE